MNAQSVINSSDENLNWTRIIWKPSCFLGIYGEGGCII